MAKLPTYFISHGGGPWPWLPAMRANFAELEQSLKQIVASWPQKPEAILMISGHWEEDQVAIMASPRPPMIYDYYGFPKETYEIVYAASGAPQLAEKALNLLSKAGIDSYLDQEQGFDHGAFAPLQIMYPEADVPVFQMSLLKSLEPEAHFNIGRAITPLREEGVVIIGSGLSFHNLRMMGPEAQQPSSEFDAWLQQSLMAPGQQRLNLLNRWLDAPYARVCHPREEHLVPLFVALGAAENASATRIYHESNFMGGVSASSYRFD